MVQSGALSEPEGECSSFSSYESLSSNSEIEEEAEEELILFKNRNRKNSTDSNTSITYSSWRLRRHRRQSSIIKNENETTASSESLTVINEGQKNWWHWMKLALFMASPFIARQLGIIAASLKLSLVASATAINTLTEYNNDFSDSSAKKSLTNSHIPLIELISEDEDNFEIFIPTNAVKINIDNGVEDITKFSPLQGANDIIDVDEYEASVGTVTSKAVESVPTLFPHHVGIRNHALNCYANALIACLYNIPNVQEALFADVLRRINEPNTLKHESLTVALASIFHKMRTTKSFVNLESFFVSAIKNTIGWEFQVMECVLEFWVRLSAALPEEVTDLFKVETTENHFRKSDNVLIKSKNHLSNIILVSPSKKYKTIEKMIENDFVDEDAEDYNVEPQEQEQYSHVLDGVAIEVKFKIPSKTTFKIANRPNVLIFGIKRIYWDAETQKPALNTTPLGFPEVLMLNEEEYTCLGNVEYDLKRQHYFAQNLDLLTDQWYVHDDKNVARIPDTIEAFNDLSDRFVTNSCMVFYIKSSLIDEYVEGDGSKLEIPAEVLAKLTSRTTAKSEKSYLKRKRGGKEQEEAAEPIEEAEIISIPAQERGRLSNKKQEEIKEAAKTVETKRQIKQKALEAPAIKKVRGPYKKNEQNIEQNNELDSFELTELESAKESIDAGIVMDPAVRLGLDVCKFIDVHRNYYLEHVLVTLSRNPSVLEIIFEEVKTKSPRDFIFRLALVITKILLGHGDVSTAPLAKELKEIHGFTFADVQSTWMDLCKLLPETISPPPDFKLVIYTNDEPIEIFKEPKCDYVKLKPHKSKAHPSGLKINGIYYDSQDNDPERTRRSIFKSNGVILPISVNRIIPAISKGESPTFDSDAFFIHCHNRPINSYIGYEPNRKETFSAHWNTAHSNQALLFYKGIPKFFTITDVLTKMIQQGMKLYSELLIFSKLEDRKKDMPMLSEVPRVLLDELNINLLSNK